MVLKTKTKRRFARLCLFLTIFSFFINSLVSGVIEVDADSDDRRQTYINLAKGKSATEMEEIKDMTNEELRCIALYLTNFYKPWNTRLNLEASASAGEGYNEEYDSVIGMMTTALSDYCGFDKDTAKYIAALCMQYNVGTRQQLYIKKDHLKALYIFATLTQNQFNSGGQHDYSSSIWDNPETYSDEKDISVGFLGAAYYENQSVFSEGSDQNAKSWLHIEGFEKYCSWVGTEKVGDTEYVKLTYPIFMSAMDLSYRMSCYDTVSSSEAKLWEQVLKKGYSTEAFIENKTSWSEDVYIRRPDLHGETWNPKENNEVVGDCLTPIMSFYWNNGGTMTPAFSNSDECMKMYALLNDDLDYKNGYGSAFLSCTAQEVGYYLDKDPAKAMLLTAVKQYMFTNWTGDLLVDNAVDLYSILPGCANPYMLTRFEDYLPYKDGSSVGKSTDLKVVQGNRLCLVNVFALANSNKIYNFPNSDRVVTYGVDSKESEGGEYTLWENQFYTEFIGSSTTNWDKELGSSFGGVYEKLYNHLEGVDCLDSDWSVGKDFVAFPSWYHIWHTGSLNFYGTSSGGNSEAPGRDKLDRIGNSDYYQIPVSKSFLFIEWSDTDSKQGRSRYRNGVSWSNNTVVAENNLKGLKENQPLSDFFQTGNIIEAADRYSSIITSKYSSINDTKIGYAQSTKAFFQPLFLTYCFAYFNSKSTDTSYNEANHVINLKMQTSSFPSGDDAVIDWSGIEISKDETANEVLSFTYYLLHPTEGIKYVATWLKNKIGGIFIGWHEDIVGSSDSNSSLGMTQYLGFSGYVTTPNLHDISWVDAVMSCYNNIVVYILIFMAIIMLTYIIVGQLTVQRAIIGYVCFGFCALLPPVFMNTTISFINTTCDTIYSSKFDYWAIVQTEEYLGRLQSYKDAENKGGSDEDILASILAVNNNAGGIEGETGYSGMRVKWISPKKFNDMAELTESMSSSLGDKGGVLQSIVINSIASTTSGETYLGSDNALYLYRDILDIYRYGAISYNIYGASGNGGISDTSFTGSALADSNKYKYDKDSSSIFYDYWKYKESGSGKLDKVSNGINTFEDVWNPTNNQVPHLSTIYDSKNLDKVYIKYAGGNTNIKITYNDTDYKGIYFRFASNLENNKYTKVTISGTKTTRKFLSDTSSLNALRNGFINSKFGNKDVNKVTNYYTQDNLATTLLMTYSGTYRTIGMHKLGYDAARQDGYYNQATDKITKADVIALNNNAMSGDSQHKNAFKEFCNNYIFAEFPEGFNYSLQSLQGSIDGTYPVDFNQLSHFYYGLYSESPYYFMNYEFRDILKADGYIYDPNNLIDRANSISTGASVNNVVDMFLKDKQSYFYNYSEGDGYGELKDFMNMHDFFYYVIPAMKTGVATVQEFDKDFGFYTYDTCPLRIQPDGTFKYDGVTIISASGEWISSQTPKDFWDNLNQQQRYEFWHDLNVNLLAYNYCSWLDTMYDCSYAKQETISVLGEKFVVTDPLDPMTYFEVDSDGNVTAGRYMVFSRSEMKYYGLNMSDLTQVEKKIIDMQDSVYKEAISLTNYYNLSNETLIHNYGLLQLFEFNKAFSQDSIFGESYTLYPQGYELKATSYDGYLRLILAGSTGESLMTDAGDEGNTSIYERIMKKTSIFFGLMLVVNDFVAVYAIPALKLFFLIIIFFISILIIVASALKVELNIVNVLWKSLLSPMIFYAGVSIGLAWIVSLFMSNGSVGVTQDSIIIQLGDPTMTIMVMLIINIVALILYWKICKKCFADFKKYVTAIYHDIFGAVAGTIGKVVGSLTSGRYDNGGSGGFSTAKQRGIGNDPKNGKSGVGGALVAGGVAGAVTSNAVNDAKEDAKRTKYNDLADKAGQKAEKLEEKQKKFNDKTFAGVNAEQKVVDAQRSDAKDKLTSATSNLKKAEKDVKAKEYTRDKTMKNATAIRNNTDSNIVDKTIATNKYKKANSDLSDAKKRRGSAKLDVKNATSRLDAVNKRQEKVDSDRNKIKNDKKYQRKQNRYNKKIDKQKKKRDGLNAKGINRYKVAAAAGMGAKAAAKATAKATGRAAKATAKATGRAAKNTARRTANLAANTAKATGRAAYNTGRATVNALADNVVESSKNV